VSSARRFSSISQATDGASVTITPYQPPTTTASTGTGTALADWYTSAPTITLTASAGSQSVAAILYAIDNPACSAANPFACTVYTAPFSVSTNGLHTLTYFSVDTVGVDEALHTHSFAVTPTSAAVSAASIGSGTNPTATAGGAAGAAGSVSVSSTGSGVVGAAVYSSNPSGPAKFNSSGAYVDVTIAGSDLSSVTIRDCDLNGGTTVAWYNGTDWVLASKQTYDPSTKCVTITVDSTTSPTLSQLTGTPIAASNPPVNTPVATTADGKPYTTGVWTNQTVTVKFTCTTNATATDPVTLANEGASQEARGTCTDGLGQKDTRTFSNINVDKTPPTCTVGVSPTVLWPANSKPVAITGTTTVGDNLSGLYSVAGSTITSNEALGSGDVQGLAINATYTSPLKLSAVLNLTGTLVAKRAGNGSGRIYSQTVTVKDQAGNANATPCAWTVTVPHDQGSRLQVGQSTGDPSTSTPALTATINARADCGSISYIQFGEHGKSFDNAQVSIASPSGGPGGQTTGFTYKPPPDTESVSLTIQRVAPTGGATVNPVRFSDGCGEWQTFVGGGPDAFR